MKLYEQLPTEIKIGDNLYPIKTDFRHWVYFERLVLSGNRGDTDELGEFISSSFTKKLPSHEDSEAIVGAIIDFYACRDNLSREKQNNEVESEISPPTQRSYDFDVDAGRIFALFYWQNGIDLYDIDYMHWWKFRALLDSAPDDSSFIKVVSIRTKETKGLKGEELTKLKRLKAHYAIEQKKKYISAQEAEADYKAKMQAKLMDTGIKL